MSLVDVLGRCPWSMSLVDDSSLVPTCRLLSYSRGQMGLGSPYSHLAAELVRILKVLDMGADGACGTTPSKLEGSRGLTNPDRAWPPPNLSSATKHEAALHLSLFRGRIKRVRYRQGWGACRRDLAPACPILAGWRQRVRACSSVCCLLSRHRPPGIWLWPNQRTRIRNGLHLSRDDQLRLHPPSRLRLQRRRVLFRPTPPSPPSPTPSPSFTHTQSVVPPPILFATGARSLCYWPLRATRATRATQSNQGLLWCQSSQSSQPSSQ
jgi:hypothetical protein